jgi:hypothetical protein
MSSIVAEMSSFVTARASELLAYSAAGLHDNWTRPVPSIITAARGAYPWPLHLGNTLWSIVAFRKVRDAMTARERPGTLTSIAVAFTMYAMAGSFVVCILFLGRPPSALQSDVILPVYLLCWLVVHYSPGDIAFRVLAQPLPLLVLGLLSEVDGYTTALNYMEEAYADSAGRFIHPLFCGLSVMLGGCSMRHFAHNGFAAGLKSYDASFGWDALWLIGVFSVYYFGALRPCAAKAACVAKTGLYEALPLVGVARTLLLEGIASLSPQQPAVVADKSKRD